jgi:hypothetical protein
MRDLVRYVPEDITLDLAKPDYGHPRGAEIVEAVYGRCTRDNPLLLCVKHGSSLYLQPRQIRRGEAPTRMWGVHFDDVDCATAPAVMSDEHKRQTEYVVRAAQRAGLRTATEVRLGGGRTRADAVVYGTTAVAVEVQLSGLTASAAVARTRKSVEAGMAMSMWLTGRQTPPAWFFRVPSLGMNELPWDVVPPAHSATATTGLRVITAAKCRFPDFNRCPKTGRGHCGGFHPRHDPWLGVTVDQVTAMAPERAVVPVRFASKFNPVLLVSPKSLATYEELTGRPAVLGLREEAERQTKPGGGRAECAADPSARPTLDWRGPAHAARYPGPCRYCGGQAFLLDEKGVHAHKGCAEQRAAGDR